MDEKFKKYLPTHNRCSSKMLEKLTTYVCWVPLIIPVAIAGACFHPSNPLRGLFQSIFEVELTISSIITWGIVICQTWGAISFIGVVMGIVLPFLVIIIICQNWLEGATLILSNMRNNCIIIIIIVK